MHKLPLRILFFLAIILIQNVRLNGQDTRRYTPPSPNATSLGLFGQIPVSEYSGVPDINIPIHVIKEGQFELPISLSYHSSGIRGADRASWVGLNWALNAGGVVTRTRRHLDDFMTNGFYKKTSNWPCNDTYDQEPDLFYFNIGSEAGKFIIDVPTGGGQYTIRQLSKTNIKIELIVSDKTWIITTPDGIKFKFTQKEFTDESAHDNSTNTTTYTENFISSWFLTSIELLNGTQIVFEYIVSSSKMTTTQGSSTTTRRLSYSPATIVCCINPLPPLEVSSSATNTINTDEVVLKKITFGEGYLDFVTGARSDLAFQSSIQGKRLDRIDLYSRNQIPGAFLVRSFLFEYDYYNAPGGVVNSTSKLRLKKINEKGVGLEKPPFVLTYNTDAISTTDKFNIGGYQTQPTNGLIETITYPTGGSTDFDFEPNEYVETGTSIIRQGGGARIKRITSSDGAGNSTVVTYAYEGGVLMGDPKPWLYLMYSTNSFITSPCCDNASPQNPTLAIFNFDISIFSDFSSLGETNNGGIIGYNKVTVYNDETGVGGKRIVLFNNTAPYMPNYVQGRIPVVVPLNVSALNGTPTDEYIYSYNSGVYNLLKHTHNVYELSEINITPARRRAFNNCGYAYNIVSEWPKLEIQTVKDYQQNGTNYSIKSIGYYYTAGNKNPSKIETVNSVGDLIRIQYKYSNELSVTQGGVYTTMVEKNMLNQPVEIVRTWLNNNLQTEKIKTVFKDWFSDGKVISPEKEEYQKATTDPTITKITYNSYDTKGNVLQETAKDGIIKSYIWSYSKSYPVAEVVNADASQIYFGDFEKNGWSSTSLIYDNTRFHTGRYSGKINNAGPGEKVAYSDQWLNISIAATTKFKYSGWIYTTGPSADISLLMKTATETGSFTYIDSKTITQTNKWVYVEGEYNVPANITKLSIRIDNNSAGNVWFDDIRLHPSEAQMSTYTYDPLVGITSQTDINNRVTYYQYDGLGRLVVVRDEEGNLLKQLCYNYAGQSGACNVVGNAIRSGTFTKNDCSNNSGSTVTYTVAANTYYASTQEEADLMALNDVNAIGQIYANNNGTCGNVAKSGAFAKNDCSSGTGTIVTYSVAANTYFASTQSAADWLAQLDVITSGQAYANANGVCDPEPCSFSAMSGFDVPYSNATITGGYVNFNLVFYPTSTTMTMYGANFVAFLYGGCKPSTVKTLSLESNGKTFQVTFYPSGDVYVQLTSGSDVEAYETVYFNGSYSFP